MSPLGGGFESHSPHFNMNPVHSSFPFPEHTNIVYCSEGIETYLSQFTYSLEIEFDLIFSYSIQNIYIEDNVVITSQLQKGLFK
jgi:hypothetical protein